MADGWDGTPWSWKQAQDVVLAAHGWSAQEGMYEECHNGCGAVWHHALAVLLRTCPEADPTWVGEAGRTVCAEEFIDADPLSPWRETVLRIAALRGEVERLSQQWERWSRTGRTDGRRDDTSRADRARLDRWTRTDTPDLGRLFRAEERVSRWVTTVRGDPGLPGPAAAADQAGVRSPGGHQAHGHAGQLGRTPDRTRRTDHTGPSVFVC